MEIVATYLKDQALARADETERDLFGRSAFNRYYYATFLITKAALGELESKWGSGDVAHSDFPVILRKSVKSILKKGYEKALKIDDGALAKQCSQAISAAEDLAKMLDEARFARTTADYHTEVRVKFAGAGGFSLNAVTVEVAKTWSPKANGLLNSIKSAWKQIHA